VVVAAVAAVVVQEILFRFLRMLSIMQNVRSQINYELEGVWNVANVVWSMYYLNAFLEGQEKPLKK
jgi:hypothetical protein